MSKIYKSSNVIIDNNNRVIVEIDNIDTKKENDNLILNENLHSLDYSIEENSNNKNIDFENLKKEIINKANEEAKLILNEANLKAEELLENSNKNGYEEGYKKGLEEGNNKAILESEKLIDDAKKIKDDAVSERKSVLENVESEIVDVIYSLTEDLIKTSLIVNEDLILVLVKQGLSEATILDKVIVKVNENNYAYINENINELYKLIDNTKNLKIIKDLSLENNDCIIETDFGYIDCSIDQKLDSLKNNLLLLLKSR